MKYLYEVYVWQAAFQIRRIESLPQSLSPSIPGKRNGAFNKLLAAERAVIGPMIVEPINVPAILLEFMKPCFLFGGHFRPERFFKGVFLRAIDRNRNPQEIMNEKSRKCDNAQIPQNLNYPEDIYPEPNHHPSDCP